MIGLGIAAWVVGMLWIFPVGWTLLTSFKTEQDASAQTLHNGLTFGRYSDVSHSTDRDAIPVRRRSRTRSWSSLVSTVIVMLLALPAAYALAIRPVPKWRDVLFFFISTKFLPIVASIFPIYVYAQKWNLIGTRTILIILYIAINLPLAIWMMRSFFMEVPRELIEAAEIDGTSALQPAALGDPADRRARHRRDRAALRDLRLERVLLRHPAELRRRLDDAAVGDRERLDARQLPREALGRFDHRLPAGRARRLGGAEADDPRPFDGCDQMRRD